MKKEKSVYQPDEEKFKILVFSKGFKNITAFANAAGVAPAGIRSNLNGKRAVTMDRLFLYADTLHVEILQLIEIFFPEAAAKNAELAKVQIPSVVLADANKKRRKKPKPENDDEAVLEIPDEKYIEHPASEDQDTSSNDTSDSDIASRLERMENMLFALVAQGNAKSEAFRNNIAAIEKTEKKEICVSPDKEPESGEFTQANTLSEDIIIGG